MPSNSGREGESGVWFPPSDPDLDFPLREMVEDARGKQRSFLITRRESGLGVTLTAEEENRDGLGFVFEAFSETSPYHALGQLREKMCRALAMRHITRRDGGIRMLHDTIRGRIASRGEGELVIVVDGIPITLDDLGQILATHEGWQFRLEIGDATDDLSR